MNSLPRKNSSGNDVVKSLSVFDHVNHIRQYQDIDYYDNLTDGDRNNFNHFMIIRVLSMDDSLVESMAKLYRFFDKIPSPQFYRLLISIVPKNSQYYPWVKTKIIRHNKDLLGYVSSLFKVSAYQATDYINILLDSESGQAELISICKSFGLSDGEVEKLFG